MKDQYSEVTVRLSYLLFTIAVMVGTISSCEMSSPQWSLPPQESNTYEWGLTAESEQPSVVFPADSGEVDDVSNPNWPLLQNVLGQAIASLEKQLSIVDWEEGQRVLLSLGYDEETAHSYPEAIDYIRSESRKFLEERYSLEVIGDIKDNLGDLDADALQRLGRTLDVDSFFFIDSIRVGFYPLEEKLPSAREFQGEAYVDLFPSLFNVNKGYYLWVGEPIFENYKGTFIVENLPIPTKPLVQNNLSMPTFGDPSLLISSQGVIHRDIVWAPDGQSLVFWSGNIDESGEYPRLVGNIWITNMSGHMHQLTRLSAEASPDTYNFLPKGKLIIFATDNGTIQVVDREGIIVHSVSTAPFSMSGFQPVPGNTTLIAGSGGTGSSTDHPDGIWVIDIESESLHPFTDLFNEGQSLVELVKESLYLGSEFIHIDNDFGFSEDDEFMVFVIMQLPSDTTYMWHRTFLRYSLNTRDLTLLGAVDANTHAGQSFSPLADRAVISAIENMGDNTCFLKIVGAQASPIQVNTSGCAYYPTWSPDGLWIAYIYSKESSSDRALWLVSADGSNPKLIANLEAERIGDLVWSPDGKYIAISARIGGEDGIWLLPVAKGE